MDWLTPITPSSPEPSSPTPDTPPADTPSIPTVEEGTPVGEPPREEKAKRSPGRKMKPVTTAVVAVVLLLAVIAFVSISAARSYKQELEQIRQNPQTLAQQEAEALIAKVGRLIVLPEGERPTIATVTDPERLRDQAFFAQAKKGDKVLIYANARKAILYDPVADKILEVAPVNIGPVAQPIGGTSPVGATPTPLPRR